MNLRDLSYLVALADCGHFGRAAERCHVSQPTLSAQIRKLEEFLGVTLFERTSRQVALTPAGEAVVARARRVLDEAEALVAEARGRAEPLAGPLALGIIPTLAPYLLPSLIPALAAAHPRLEPVFHEDLTAPLLALLRDHGLDACLVALPVEEPDLTALPLFEEPFLVAAAEGDPVTVGDPVPLARLGGARLLLLTDGHCLRDQALTVCRLAGAAVPAGGDFRATSLETLRQLAIAGRGHTLLPALACQRPTPGLVLRRLDPPASREIGLVHRSSSPRAAELALLAGTIRARLPAAVRALR
ncbi:transcriptional regulator, LysR family [Tistlia consotensis]|uniref:Transcriptional regulator, LysR family n=1 Tax=Tistlia consotensis USBA 355 TaxID=560819 RepID=A0A1Y6BJ05_9PROT|nr:LysR substrate-binding domain-containing protein [Tistlia consotensis]SMF10138.1 transcriptional regulator, LysR family [Tistlia consotensis USBA 355]SNR33955.1 transcriptional regulator, LysR family [Tistlia consotensis]